MQIPQWLTGFLTQIVQDGDWQHGNGENMTDDVCQFLQSLGIKVEPGTSKSKVIDIARAPVVTTLELVIQNQYELNERAFLLFECGRIKFSIELDELEILRLLRGGKRYATAHLGTIPLLRVKDLKLMDQYVVLDVDTLEMPTIDEGGHVQSAATRLAKKEPPPDLN